MKKISTLSKKSFTALVLLALLVGPFSGASLLSAREAKANTVDAPSAPDSPNAPNSPESPTSPNCPSSPNSPNSPSAPNAPSAPNSPNAPNTPHTPHTTDQDDDCLTDEEEEGNNTGGTVKVTIMKYVDGRMATAESADSTDFPMTSAWNADNIGAGSGTYSLSENGYNGNPTPYQAITREMTSGADYSTQEITNTSAVGTNCDIAGTDYALVGYTTGNTLAAAQSATPSMAHPSFTNLPSDKYVIVWNDDCSTNETPDPNPTTSVVTIQKYVDGTMATDQSADNTDFQMNATYVINGTPGTGQYALSETGYNGDTTPYQAKTIELPNGSDYGTNEIMDSNVGASCSTGKPYALTGYKYGNTLAQAQSATTSMTAPSFTNIQSDKFVIVWNDDCSTNQGEENNNGELMVTSIEMTDSTATANNSYEDGWEYVFNITVPTNEPNIRMKFDDWARTGGGGTIPAGGNMRISSAQASNGGATVPITAANTYSNPPLTMTTDLNPALPGIQVKVTVEVKIPTGTPNGSYTTNYGVKSEE